MFGLLIKFFNSFFVARAFHVCFMNLIDIVALIVSNAVLIVMMICKIVNFVSKKVCFILAASEPSIII